MLSNRNNVKLRKFERRPKRPLSYQIFSVIIWKQSTKAPYPTRSFQLLYGSKVQKPLILPDPFSYYMEAKYKSPLSYQILSVIIWKQSTKPLILPDPFSYYMEAKYKRPLSYQILSVIIWKQSTKDPYPTRSFQLLYGSKVQKTLILPDPFRYYMEAKYKRPLSYQILSGIIWKQSTKDPYPTRSFQVLYGSKVQKPLILPDPFSYYMEAKYKSPLSYQILSGIIWKQSTKDPYPTRSFQVLYGSKVHLIQRQVADGIIGHYISNGLRLKLVV